MRPWLGARSLTVQERVSNQRQLSEAAKQQPAADPAEPLPPVAMAINAPHRDPMVVRVIDDERLGDATATTQTGCLDHFTPDYCKQLVKAGTDAQQAMRTFPGYPL